PLELAQSAVGKNDLILESTLYLSTADNLIHFGPRAIEISRSEDDPHRERFDSPKQRLSIEGVEGLSGRVDGAHDPEQRFSKRDFITLYLGYLSAMISDQLIQKGADAHTQRRFAIPVWSNQQIAETSRILRQMLLDGQVLADTVPLEIWKTGLGISDAKQLIAALRRELPDNDPR